MGRSHTSIVFDDIIYSYAAYVIAKSKPRMYKSTQDIVLKKIMDVIKKDKEFMEFYKQKHGYIEDK